MSYLKPRSGAGQLGKQAVINIRLPEHRVVWEEAKGRAWAAGVTVTSLVIEALAEYFRAHPKGPDGKTPPEAAR